MPKEKPEAVSRKDNGQKKRTWANNYTDTAQKIKDGVILKTNMDEFRCYGGHELKPGVLWGS
jgi:5-methylcytosine-specific restriction endonuclease McrBC GTP-binding regulatory subunit McrB